MVARQDIWRLQSNFCNGTLHGLQFLNPSNGNEVNGDGGGGGDGGSGDASRVGSQASWAPVQPGFGAGLGPRSLIATLPPQLRYSAVHAVTPPHAGERAPHRSHHHHHHLSRLPRGSSSSSSSSSGSSGSDGAGDGAGSGDGSGEGSDPAAFLRASVTSVLAAAGLSIPDTEPAFRFHFPPSGAAAAALGTGPRGVSSAGASTSG